MNNNKDLATAESYKTKKCKDMSLTSYCANLKISLGLLTSSHLKVS